MSQSRTPSRARISGQISSTATVASEKHLLRGELAGRLSDISFAHFCHAFLLREQDVNATLELAALELKESQPFREAYGEFSAALSSPAGEGTAIYVPLVNLMNYVVRCERARETIPDAMPLMFTNHSSTLPIRGSASQRKPDIVGIPFIPPVPAQPGQQQPPPPDWSTVSLVCEYKLAPVLRSSTPTPTVLPLPSLSDSQQGPRLSSSRLREPDLQLARYMLEMRTAQPTREAGYGIQFMRDKASFWYSDADSTIRSESVPIDSKEFITAIMCLARASATGLGHSPEFRDAAGATTTQIIGASLTFNNVLYTITEVLSRARAIHGRCSCVLAATDPDGNECAIKLSWQVTTRVNEVELIKLAHERGVKSIVEVLYSEDLRRLSEGRRSRLPPTVCQSIRVEDRHLRVLVLPLYMPLYKVLDPNHFLRASISLLDAIYDLYYLGKILHRDVSVNNLMVRRERPWEGVLIDLDLAHEEKLEDGDGPEPTSLHRTGTLPFMALDLLHDRDGYPHYHRHDLESFVYVLAWIAGRYDNGVEVNDVMFERWCQGDWTTISDNKSSFLSFKDPYSTFRPTPSYDFLRRPLAQLRLKLDEAHAQARRSYSIADAELPLRTRPSKHDEQPDEGYVDASSGSKRKRQTHPGPVYPEHLTGVTRDVFSALLLKAISE